MAHQEHIPISDGDTYRPGDHHLDEVKKGREGLPATEAEASLRRLSRRLSRTEAQGSRIPIVEQEVKEEEQSEGDL